MTAEAQHTTIGRDHVEPDHALGDRTVAPRAEEDAALRQRAADARAQSGQRPVVRRADTVGRERVEQLLPGRAALHGHEAVLGIDDLDAVHGQQVDHDRVRRLRQIAVGVGHAAAPRHDRQPRRRDRAQRLRQLFGGRRPDERGRQFARAVHVLRMELEFRAVGDDLCGTEHPAELGQRALDGTGHQVYSLGHRAHLATRVGRSLAEARALRHRRPPPMLDFDAI